MKKTLAKGLALAFIGSLFVAGSAMALPITGGISFVGDWLPTGGTGISDATGIDFWLDLSGDGVLDPGEDNKSSVKQITGSFLTSVSIGDVAGITDFIFSPDLAPNPVSPLWTVGGFSFDMDTLQVKYQDQFALLIEGSGTLSHTSLDDTVGRWTFSGNGDGGTFAWSGSTAAVPEPATMLLFGTGLAGLATLRRRKANK